MRNAVALSVAPSTVQDRSLPHRGPPYFYALLSSAINDAGHRSALEPRRYPAFNFTLTKVVYAQFSRTG
jgi:hypothetical protein